MTLETNMETDEYWMPPEEHDYIIDSVKQAMYVCQWEFNDALTRKTLYKHLQQRFDMTPKLKDMDVLVVCDETNNTPKMVDDCEMHVDVYTKKDEDTYCIEITYGPDHEARKKVYTIAEFLAAPGKFHIEQFKTEKA